MPTASGQSSSPARRATAARWRTDDLFEAGRAVLTPAGQARLDEIARWCKYAGQPTSQIVIAAYTDDVRNRELAEILTQEQADTVRKYLVDKHAVQSAGWFKTRKVAAVGFGTQAPPTLDPCPRAHPHAASRSSCSRRRPSRAFRQMLRCGRLPVFSAAPITMKRSLERSRGAADASGHRRQSLVCAMASLVETCCHVGAAGLIGLSLPRLLAADPALGTAQPRAKSLILFVLEGGPAHQDLWDMKPDAPAEIRGEFKPIATTVPGLSFCEHLPHAGERRPTT